MDERDRAMWREFRRALLFLTLAIAERWDLKPTAEETREREATRLTLPTPTPPPRPDR